jgi:hypothetical protein
MKTPEQRAAEMVSVGCKEPGGPCFIRLHGPGADVLLGPHLNKQVAEEKAEAIKRFLAAVIQEAAAEGTPPP